jgi:crotonobetaine/carnitine-CoA ligase
MEVESELLEHPSVAECAVVGIPSQWEEDDVMAVLRLEDGMAVTPEEICDFVAARAPSFWVPRYIRIVQEMPTTATQRIMKHQLRAEAVTPDTWDSESPSFSA